MHESEFISWFATAQSDCEEAKEEVNELFEKLLTRLDLNFDDDKIPLLRDFLFTDYEPL